MSSTKITLLSLCMVAFVAACAKTATEEVVYVEEPAMSSDVPHTSKYK